MHCQLEKDKVPKFPHLISICHCESSQVRDDTSTDQHITRQILVLPSQGYSSLCPSSPLTTQSL
jgi:hypothetical protein